MLKTHNEAMQSLLHFHPIEIWMRSHYMEHKELCSIGQLLKSNSISQNSEIDMYSDEFQNISHNIWLNLEDLELSESSFVNDCDDICVMKHPRYGPSILHRHEFFEILYVYQGTCTNVIDGEAVRVKEGDMYIIPPRVYHSVAVDTDDCVVVNLLVRASTFDKSFTSLLSEQDILSTFFTEIAYSKKYRKFLLFRTGGDERLKDIILSMYSVYMEKGVYYAKIINGYFFVLMGTLLQHHEGSVEYPAGYFEKYNVVPEVLRLIDNRRGNISLEECAQRYHFNERHLARMLKKETGMTFPQLLTDARMKAAKAILKTSGIPLEDLAESLGYNNASYFIRVFKQEEGCTPNDFRRQRDNT